MPLIFQLRVSGQRCVGWFLDPRKKHPEKTSSKTQSSNLFCKWFDRMSSFFSCFSTNVWPCFLFCSSTFLSGCQLNPKGWWSDTLKRNHLALFGRSRFGSQWFFPFRKGLKKVVFWRLKWIWIFRCQRSAEAKAWGWRWRGNQGGKSSVGSYL